MIQKYVSIYYANLPHPSESKAADRLYSKIHHDSFLPTVSISKAEFKKYWTKIPIKEKITQAEFDEKSFERIFNKYNRSSLNPIATLKGQIMIRSIKVRHTSMSVGDIIKSGREAYVVSNIGFKLVKFT